jgi:hypothetical protein
MSGSRKAPGGRITFSVMSRSAVLTFVSGKDAFSWDLDFDPPQYMDRLFLGDSQIRLGQEPCQRGNLITYTFDILHGRFLTEDGKEISRLKVQHHVRSGVISFGHVKEEGVGDSSSPAEPSQQGRDRSCPRLIRPFANRVSNRGWNLKTG